MKISRIQVKNYRSLKNLDLKVDSYAALVGANGSGKSSILYSLQWFFNGGPLQYTDFHGYSRDEAPATAEEPDLRSIEITVTFSSLTERDKQRLEQYGRGETASFKRTWKLGDGDSKVVGNATQGPGFAAVRGMKLVGDFRPAYNNLRATITDLPALTSPSKDQVVAAFVAWENNPTNADLLEEIDSDDASHMFGIGGSAVIKQCARMVLIPAASDIASEVDGNKKGSAINELIGTLMANAGAAAKEAWILRNAAVIDDLTTSMRTSVQASTGLQAERINERLTSLVPNAELSFLSDVPAWIPSPSATVQTDVTIDGSKNDISRQGHGIQRAVMIAMFQSLIPDAKLVSDTHELLEGETEAQAEARLESILADLPHLIICIEEPEIYQHPIRARAFARVLVELAKQSNAQVILATHSPYFVRPEQFSSLRRFTLSGGETGTSRADIPLIQARSSASAAQIKKIVEKRLPTNFSEGFFADAVVLVEGDTDKAVLEATAEKLDMPFDSSGISVLDMAGKEGLSIPYAMLSELNIPVYVVADGDSLGANRKHGHKPDRQPEIDAHTSHRAATEAIIEWLPSSTPIVGSLPYTFEDPSIICEDYAIWNDDIESELENWPSFITALNANGYQIRAKDLLAYRTAVLEADINDIPDNLKQLVLSIQAFRAR